MEEYFLIHRWKANNVPFSLHTEKDLRRIHRNFGHQSIKATTGLLKRVAEGRLNPSVKRTSKKIDEACLPCKKYANKPRRFKLTVGKGSLRFNHTEEIDTMFITVRPVLHIIDLATHDCAAAFLQDQSTDSIWKNHKLSCP